MKRSDSRYEADLAAKGGINPFEHLDDLMTEEALADPRGGGFHGRRRVGRRRRDPDLRKMRQALAEESAVKRGGRIGESSRVRRVGLNNRPPTNHTKATTTSTTVTTVTTLDTPRTITPDNTSLLIRKDLTRLTARSVAPGLFLCRAAAARLRDDTAGCAVLLERLAGSVTVSGASTLRRAVRGEDVAASSAQGKGRRVGSYGDVPAVQVPTRRKNMCTFVTVVRSRGTGTGTKSRHPGTKCRHPRTTGTRRSKGSSGFGAGRTEPAAAPNPPADRRLNEILSNDPDDKVVVFAQRPDTVAAIAARVEAAVAAELPQTSTRVVQPRLRVVRRDRRRDRPTGDGPKNRPVVVTLLGSASARRRRGGVQSPDVDVAEGDVPRVRLARVGAECRANHVVITHLRGAKRVPGART